MEYHIIHSHGPRDAAPDAPGAETRRVLTVRQLNEETGISVIIVTLMLDIGSLILVEAALSYLGLGVKPPTPTWGNMLTKAQQYMLRPDGRHLVIAPGVMITLTVLCLFVIGDGLRDAMDPRLR